MLEAGMAITGLAGLGILVIGTLYLVTPRGMAANFGLPSVPEPQGTPWLRVKGIRDSATGVAAFVLLLTASPHTIALALVAFCIIPAGDALIIVLSGGSRRTAWAIHGSTAALMLVGATMLWLA